jgi:hypothetical protein
MALTKTSFSMIEGAAVNPADFGAVGDGVANDAVALQAAIDSIYQTGGSIWLKNGAVYNIYDQSLRLSGNVNIYGNGATIFKSVAAPSNSAFLCDPVSLGTSFPCNVGSGNYTKAITTSTASNAGNFAPGDFVYVSWGINPFDNTLPYANSINIVRSANSTNGNIQLEFNIPYDWAYTQTPQIRKLNYPWTGVVRDLTIQMVDSTTAGFYCNYSLYGRIENCTFIDCASVCIISAICNALYVDGLKIRRINNDAFDRATPVNAWASTNCTFNNVNQFNATGTNASFLIESQCRNITISNSHMIGNNANTIPAVVFADNSSVQIINSTFENFTAAWSTRYGGVILASNNLVRTASLNPVSGDAINFVGNSLETLAGVRRTVRSTQTFTFTTTNIPGTSTFEMTPVGNDLALADGMFLGISCKLSTPVTSGANSLRIRAYVGANDQPLKNVTDSYQQLASFSDDNSDKMRFSAGDRISVEVIANGLTPATTIDIECQVLVGYGT